MNKPIMTTFLTVALFLMLIGIHGCLFGANPNNTPVDSDVALVHQNDSAGNSNDSAGADGFKDVLKQSGKNKSIHAPPQIPEGR